MTMEGVSQGGRVMLTHCSGREERVYCTPAAIEVSRFQRWNRHNLSIGRNAKKLARELEVPKRLEACEGGYWKDSLNGDVVRSTLADGANMPDSY